MKWRSATVAVIVGILMALVVMPAAAQGVAVNPTTVVFDPSPDHNLTGLDGQPKVTSYMLRFYLEGASSPVQEQTLGKPTPGGDGKITITNRSLFTGTPLALDTRYVAKVAAIGPTGEGLSDPSNPFGNAEPPRQVPTAPLIR